MTLSPPENHLCDIARKLGPAFRGVEAAVVLGSGLSEAAGALGVGKTVDYFAACGRKPAVPGHPGLLGATKIGKIKTAVFLGRAHYYEERSMESAALAVRLAAAMGAKFCALFCAVGSLRDDFSTGDWVFVEDHLNFMGQNPLAGVLAEGGPPFLDLGGLYSPELHPRISAMLPGMEVKKGVLAAFSGPTYETPAEVRMAKALGADVVGMSSVPEAVWARHLGLKAAVFARVANPAAGLSPSPLRHEDVVRESSLGGDEAAMIASAAIAAWAAERG